MPAIILVILAVLWAAFFAWPYLQRRLSGARRDSVGDFSKRVGAIGGLGGRSTRPATPPLPLTGPVAPMAAPLASGTAPVPTGLPTSPDAVRRRRDALAIFGVAVVGSLLLALVTGSTVLWILHGLSDVLFVGFLVLLAATARRSRERRAKVHYLPQSAPAQSSALVLRRTASS